MTNNKEKYAFWLTPEAKKMIEINAPLANCGSQSEFVEKAVRFYDGYLKVQNAGAFLPHGRQRILSTELSCVISQASLAILRWRLFVLAWV